MKVLIDGKQVECLNDVKIIHENQLLGVEKWKAITGDLIITHNSAGMWADTIRDGTTSEVYKTTWKDVEDIIEETH